MPIVDIFKTRKVLKYLVKIYKNSYESWKLTNLVLLRIKHKLENIYIHIKRQPKKYITIIKTNQFFNVGIIQKIFEIAREIFPREDFSVIERATAPSVGILYQQIQYGCQISFSAISSGS